MFTSRMTALGFTFLGFTAGIGALACSTVGDASDEDPFRGSAAGADGGGGAGDGSAAAGGDEPGLVGGGSNAGGSTGGASTACDAAIAIEDIDPFYAAAAMGLCQRYDGSADGWGLVSATYMMPNGDAGMNPISHGILSNFGVVEPFEGDRFAVLSSGTARPPGHLPGIGCILKFVFLGCIFGVFALVAYLSCMFHCIYVYLLRILTIMWPYHEPKGTCAI